MSRPSRDVLLEQMNETMRLFMARAVLYQDAVAKSVGMNATDLQCANLLLIHGPMTAGELAERAGLTAGGAITGVIDRLERAGLVRRGRDAADRRRVVITADAEKLRERVGAVYARIGERWGEYVATLDDAQVAFVNEFLAKAAELNLDETDRLRRTETVTSSEKGAR
jgi:DNA-binding MarR family transcriptional regulator